jgi:hypothetical protein
LAGMSCDTVAWQHGIFLYRIPCIHKTVDQYFLNSPS